MKALSGILNPRWWSFTADRRAQFEKLEYTEEDYQQELEHIEQVKPPVLFYISNFGEGHAYTNLWVLQLGSLIFYTCILSPYRGYENKLHEMMLGSGLLRNECGMLFMLFTRLFPYPYLFLVKKLSMIFSKLNKCLNKTLFLFFLENVLHVCIFLWCLESLYPSFQFLLESIIQQLKHGLIDLF